MTNSSHLPIMSEKDLVNTVLSDEKRTVTEYAIAATEASCEVVRQCFTQMFNDTLQIHNQMFDMMSQQGWYNPSPAPQQQIQQELQEHRQTGQQTQQWIAQLQSGTGASAGIMQSQASPENQRSQPMQRQ